MACLLVLLLSSAAAKDQASEAASTQKPDAVRQDAKPAASSVPENIRNLLLWVLQNDGVVCGTASASHGPQIISTQQGCLCSSG